MNRRRCCMVFTCAWVFLFAGLAANSAAQDFDSVQIKTVKVTEGVFFLEGMGGNIGVCAGEDAVFLIDDQYAPPAEKISAAVAELSDLPISFVVNTHWHWDHSGGGKVFQDTGAQTVMHKRAAEWLDANPGMETSRQKARQKIPLRVTRGVK